MAAIETKVSIPVGSQRARHYQQILNEAGDLLKGIKDETIEAIGRRHEVMAGLARVARLFEMAAREAPADDEDETLPPVDLSPLEVFLSTLLVAQADTLEELEAIVQSNRRQGLVWRQRREMLGDAWHRFIERGHGES